MVRLVLRVRPDLRVNPVVRPDRPVPRVQPDLRVRLDRRDPDPLVRPAPKATLDLPARQVRPVLRVQESLVLPVPLVQQDPSVFKAQLELPVQPALLVPQDRRELLAVQPAPQVLLGLQAPQDLLDPLEEQLEQPVHKVQPDLPVHPMEESTHRSLM